MVNVRRSLVGETFGKLHVICQAEDYISPSGSHYAQYECACACGNNVIVAASKLKNGHTQSCGCLNVESHIKHNTYNLCGEYGIGYTSDNREFYFDIEDYEKIYPYTWYFDADGYVVSDTYGKHTKMHRLITNAKYNFDVDHIGMNESRYDNRKINLRMCSRAENSRNKTYMSNNTSGCIGVCWHKASKKWMARITINEENIYLGLFDNKEDAINARITAEKEYFEKFAPIRKEAN